MLKTLTRLVTLLLLCAAAHAQEQDARPRDDSNAGVVYGRDHAFAIKAPAGWVLDNRSGARHGIHAAFYPEGSSWKAAPAVMYANAAHTGDAPASLEDFIAGDIRRFKQDAPALKVTDGATPALPGRQQVIVKHFSGDAHGNHEAVAYIAESKVVVMIVLTSRTRETFEASLPAFGELLASYRFLSDKVKTVQ